MLAQTNIIIARAYAARPTFDQVKFNAALHDLHVAREKALIEACLRCGGVVRTREGQLRGPLQVLLAEADGEAATHLQVAMALANNGHDEGALKSLRSAIESTVLRIADNNATFLDLGERVQFQFIPDRPARVPSREVA